MRKLRRLDLWQTPVTEYGIATILANEDLCDLIALDIARCGDVGNVGIRSVFQTERLSGLRVLSLAGNGITGDALAEISGTALEQLYALNLAGNPIGYQGVKQLAMCPALKSIRYLNLSGCGLTNWDVRDLAESFPALRGLRLAGNQISDKSIDYLTSSPWRLELLDVAYCSFTAEGITRLLKHPWSSSLRYLGDRRAYRGESWEPKGVKYLERVLWEIFAPRIDARPPLVRFEDESRRSYTPYRVGNYDFLDDLLLHDAALARQAYSAPIPPPAGESD